MGNIEDLRKVIQDFVAPDLKALTMRVDGLEKSMNARFDVAEKRMDERFDAAEKQTDLKLDLLIKTIEAFRAEMRSEFMILKLANQAEVSRQIAPLSERIAVLESAKL
jgi:hypothetical protein